MRNDFNSSFKVVYAWNYLEWGGAQMYFLGLAARLRGAGIEASALMPRGTSATLLEFFADRGVPVEFLDDVTDLAPAPSLARKIARRVNRFRAERALVRRLIAIQEAEPRVVVHAELPAWESVASLARLARRGPVFVTMHNSLPPVSALRRALWRLKFRILAAVENFHLFTSNAEARESLRGLAPDEFVERVRVTYTNVNPDEIGAALGDASFDRAAERRRLGVPEDAFAVFALGQFIDRKGRWTLLEAAERAAETDPRAFFIWITNSEVSADDLARIGASGVGARFRVVASREAGATRSELMRAMRAADAFALPSFQEGLPISLLEAMALGIPSVSTCVNAIPEAVIDDETGVLVPPGDAEALAKALLWLAASPADAARLAAAGRAHVSRSFSEDAVAEVALAAYREALGQE